MRTLLFVCFTHVWINSTRTGNGDAASEQKDDWAWTLPNCGGNKTHNSAYSDWWNHGLDEFNGKIRRLMSIFEQIHNSPDKAAASMFEVCHGFVMGKEIEGGWTAHRIQDLRPWFNRKYGDYYLSQLLCGHGSFQCYLCAIRSSRSPNALRQECDGCCLPHLSFCRKWERHRHHLAMDGCQVSPDTIINGMLQREDTSSRVARCT